MRRQSGKEMAFHEAGHAAMVWFFAESWNVVEIDMKPDGNTAARVWIHDDLNLEYLASLPRNKATEIATRVIMRKLAGDRAQKRVAGNYFLSQFELLLQLKGEYLKKYLKSWNWNHDGHKEDFPLAVSIAKVLYHEDRQLIGFLRRLGRWTDECLSHPWMWTVVTALASKLKPGIVLDGQLAWEIMESAWKGPKVWNAPLLHFNPPYFTLGSKWKRRFQTLKRAAARCVDHVRGVAPAKTIGSTSIGPV